MIQAEARRTQNVAYAITSVAHSHGLCHPGEWSSELRVEAVRMEKSVTKQKNI